MVDDNNFNLIKNMSKFSYCYEANGLMWCVYPNGVHAKPFPASYSRKTKKLPPEEEKAD